MQIIIVGLLIMTALIGFFAKAINSHRPSQSMQSEEFTETLNPNDKLKLQNMVNQLDDQKRRIMEYLRDEQLSVKDRSDQMGSLSEAIDRLTKENKNFDLLRLKSLMKDFENQSGLLIKNGGALASFNDRQKKVHLGVKNFLGEKIEEELRLQQIFMDQQRAKSRILKDKILEIQAQARQLHDKHKMSEEVAVFEKLQQLSDSTLVNIDKLDARREKLKIISDSNAIHMAAMKDRLDDLKEKNRNSIEQNRIHIQEQNQKINDRIHDQMERMKDKRDNKG